MTSTVSWEPIVIPTGDRDIPDRDIPGSDIPDRDVSGRDIPGSDIPDRDVSGRDIPGSDIPDRDVSGSDIVGDDTPGPDIHGRHIHGRIYRPDSDLGTPTHFGNTAPPQARSGEPGVLVWAHGGSWRTGSVAEWHPALMHLASLTGATVVGVDYRLAPEHPHPAPLLDVLAALDWASGIADGAPVSVGGDSAGATLAAAAALVRRDTGRSPAAQVLAYPPVDPACGAASYRRDPGAFPRRADLAAAWRAYRGNGRPDSGLYSTPADAADVSGVAPAALVVGTLDPVADDVRAYAARLAAAGVPAALHELPGTGHGAFLGSAEFRRRLATVYLATLHGRTPVARTPAARTPAARTPVAHSPVAHGPVAHTPDRSIR